MLPITEVVIKKLDACLIKVNLIALFIISNFRYCQVIFNWISTTFVAEEGERIVQKVTCYTL